jgi:membrane-bound lytic murein transglycosylase MltF
LSHLNRTLFAFASYNAGPARVADLRREAQEEGLDPDKWFGNVELVAAREIGSETVTYVSNIYKYFVGYEMAAEAAYVRKRSAG